MERERDKDARGREGGVENDIRDRNIQQISPPPSPLLSFLFEDVGRFSTATQSTVKSFFTPRPTAAGSEFQFFSGFFPSGCNFWRGRSRFYFSSLCFLPFISAGAKWCNATPLGPLLLLLLSRREILRWIDRGIWRSDPQTQGVLRDVVTLATPHCRFLYSFDGSLGRFWDLLIGGGEGVGSNGSRQQRRRQRWQ